MADDWLTTRAGSDRESEGVAAQRHDEMPSRMMGAAVPAGRGSTAAQVLAVDLSAEELKDGGAP